MSGYHIAEKLNIPGFLSLPTPLFTPTTAFPCPIFPDFKLGGWYNRLTYNLLPLLTLPYLNIINRWREQSLGLPRCAWNSRKILGSYGEVPILYSYSPHVVPQPSDWDNNSAIATDYWFLDTPFEPPSQLINFLAAGKPPVCIGFGSMTGQNPQTLAEIVLAALRQTQQRGILLTGWGGIGNPDLSDDILQLEAVPHDWLFPKVAAIIHHGGAGTTAAGLRAGIPTIVIPFFGDQPFWGKRVEQLGVGTKPIPRKQLTAEKLVAAIQTAISDETMRSRAVSLGQKIRAENGVARAVEAIESFCNTSTFKTRNAAIDPEYL